MKVPDLAPDCSACAALCCVALAFDEGDSFAMDKPAGLPCPHLAHHHCSIYDRLDAEGFSGCSRYDCEGAGQRTRALHGGDSWQDELELLAPMLETFRHLRWIHEQIGNLITAGRLPLEDDEEVERDRLLQALCAEDLTPEDARDLATGTVRQEVLLFFKSLSHHI